jgi:phosphoglycolate phosphatase/putative hydrolase of the HAD superfamily
MPIAWQKKKLVIFDVDGTLYSERLMRVLMMRELCTELLTKPSQWTVLQQVRIFRHVHEELAGTESSGLFARQVELTSHRLGIETSTVQRTVNEWMFFRPLRHLARCRFTDLPAFITALENSGTAVAFLSDYPCTEKIQALGLDARNAFWTDHPAIGASKPSPNTLTRVASQMGFETAASLLIGDRDDRDGEAARRAGMEYLIKSRRRHDDEHNFFSYDDLLRQLNGSGNHTERS